MTNTQQPNVCRIVLYMLNEADARTIEAQRGDRADYSAGNAVAAGQAYPAVVVRNFGSSVNLQVLLDGPDSYWATSRVEGDGQGQWCWPPRV